MREIKFRFVNEVGNMVYINIWEMRPPLKESFLQKGTNLMQYTGLQDDKNGKEIYEGDIVTGLWYDCPKKDIMILEWSEKIYGFIWNIFGSDARYPIGISGLHDIEIIGNIYSNPELLSD
jgi:uncharacterized phage protein (TIGR01671 family)